MTRQARAFLADSCAVAGCTVARWRRTLRTSPDWEEVITPGVGRALTARGELATELRTAGARCRSCSRELVCEVAP